jgi:hypothetical protein
MFEHGVLNLTNWMANVVMPTLAGLFFAAAVYRFSRGLPVANLGYSGFAALMCSGLLRALETFAQQSGFADPDRYWISMLTLVNWVANVMLPLYGTLQVAVLAAHFGGVLERLNIGDAWVRNLLGAMMSFGLSGLLRLAEFWIENGTAGVR